MAFRRALTAFDATMVVVGGIIGSGIFMLPSLVAQRLPSAGLVLAAWVAGGAIALAGAFAFAELATLFPKAGGQYVYLREAYHPLVAFLFGWASLLMIQGGGLGAVAITFSQYALRLLDSDFSPAAGAAIVDRGRRRDQHRRREAGQPPPQRDRDPEAGGAGHPDRRRAPPAARLARPGARAGPGARSVLAARLRQRRWSRSSSRTADGRASTCSPRRPTSRAARFHAP